MSQIKNQGTNILRQRGVVNAKMITDSLDLLANLLQERNALISYSEEDCETEQVKGERRQFLRMSPRRYLLQIRQQINQAPENGRSVISSGSNFSSHDATSASTRRQENYQVLFSTIPIFSQTQCHLRWNLG